MKVDQEKTDEAFINLLRSLPTEVADRLHKKYEDDRREFLQVVEDMTPSKDPAYWAKRSCTKCYGRGILGVVIKPSGERVTPACDCTSKLYSRWLVDVRRFYTALKAQGRHEAQQSSN